MPHKTRPTLIAASIILILMKIKLQAFRVAGAFFRVANEMRRLLAYFGNPDEITHKIVQFSKKTKFRVHFITFTSIRAVPCRSSEVSCLNDPGIDLTVLCMFHVNGQINTTPSPQVWELVLGKGIGLTWTGVSRKA